mgnify:CR=1 FL=1
MRRWMGLGARPTLPLVATMPILLKEMVYLPSWVGVGVGEGVGLGSVVRGRVRVRGQW